MKREETEEMRKARAELGAQLRQFRKKTGVSKYAITRNGGIHINTINAMETGSSTYTIDSLLRYLAETGGLLAIKAGRPSGGGARRARGERSEPGE